MPRKQSSPVVETVNEPNTPLEVLRQHLNRLAARRTPAAAPKPNHRYQNPLKAWLKAHPETSQRALGKRLGYEHAMMSMIVNGRRPFHAKKILKCVDLTGISERDLLLIYEHGSHHNHRPGRRRKPPPG
jgi:hypothetical protein